MENFAVVRLKSNITHPNQIFLSPRKTRKYLFVIVVCLFTASTIGIYAKEVWDIGIINRLFNFDKEANIPTLFSSLLLFISSALLFIIYRTSSSKRFYWIILSLIFLFLCIDETAQIHEIFNNRKSPFEIINRTQIKHLWVLPYFMLVLLVGLFFKKFLFTLPTKTRNLFILSGIIYVTGAIGLEVLQEILKIYNPDINIVILKLLYSLEEACEMVGISIFIYALLNYIAPTNLSLHIDHTK